MRTHDRPRQTFLNFLFVAVLLWHSSPLAQAGPRPAADYTALESYVLAEAHVPDPDDAARALPLGAPQAQLAPTLAVGTLPGAFKVSENGAALYTIALTLPPGTAGLTPKLAVTYDHQNGPGILGAGWSLDGSVSLITRCPANSVDHGLIDAVDFDASDRFCLDGQLLVAVTGDYGANGAVYHTASQSFARVVSYGRLGDGPERFTVWTRTGHVLDYGGSSDARIAASGRADVLYWGLSRIADRRGNQITTTYTQPAPGEAYPLRISYTGNPALGLAPYAAVEFVYEQRPDPIESYVAGSAVRIRQRLQALRVLVDTTLVREYRFRYDEATATGRSQLVSLTECAYDGSCLPPTTFAWAPYAVREGSFLSAGTGFWGAPTDGLESYAADFDGDGRTDLATYSGDGLWRVCLAASASASMCSVWSSEQSRRNGHHVADVNGDGRADLITTSDEGQWFVCHSTGSGFACGHSPTRGPLGAVATTTVVDVNGDGRSDLLKRLDEADARWEVCVSTGAGFDCGSGFWDAYSGVGANTFGDVNGDSMADLVAFMGNGLWRVCPSTGSNFTCFPYYWTGPVGGLSDNLAGDVNGDGLLDLLSPSGGAAWRVCRSTGINFECGLADWPGHAFGAASSAAADWNGDGRTDLAGYAGNERWQVCLSTGTTFRCDSTLWPGPDRGALNTLLGDINGDGNTDMLARHSVNSWYALITGGPGTPMLTAITNGYGERIEITYRTLADPAVHHPDSLVGYPQRALAGSFPVVTSVARDNGIGGRNRSTWAYAGLRIDQLRRTPLGFRTITARDEQTGISTTTVFSQEPIYKQRPIQQETRLADGRVIERLRQTWAHLQDGATSFPYVAQSMEERFELSGALTSSTSTTHTYDQFGNPTQVVVETNDGYRRTTTSSYRNDPERWLIGLTTQVQTTSQIGGQPQTMRTFAVSYDPTTGQPTREASEPGTSFELTRAYERDGYGNIVRASTSGAGLLPREQRFSYDLRARFVVQETNALGHRERRVNDPLSGNLTSLTSANGQTTNWTFDAYGRVLAERLPYGAQTTTSYGRCTAGACPATAVYSVRVSAAGAPTRALYYDVLNRQVREETGGFDGRPIMVDTEFDAVGNKARVSNPYIAGQSTLWMTYGYDILGRTTTTVLSDGSSTTVTYEGLTTVVTDALGRNQTRVVNSQGWLVRSIDTTGATVQYAYNSAGNVIGVTDPAGNTTIMQYDLAGRQIAITAPGLGTTEFRYNAVGEQIWQRTARGQESQSIYDLLGRLVEHRQPEGVTRWTYDTAPRGLGKLARVQAPGGFQESYSYDQFGRLNSTRTVIDGQSFTIGSTFDSAGRLLQTTYPTGFRVRNVYNSHGHLAQVRNATTNALYWRADALNARGQLTRETLGNGLITTRAYDAATGRPLVIQTGTAAAPTSIQHGVYSSDALGNLTAREDRRQGLIERFTYDHLNRLTSAQVAGQAPITVAYDLLGNISAKSDIGAYVYGENGASPHAVTRIEGPRAQVYSYDPAGNRVSSRGGSVTYTSFQKPSQISDGINQISLAYGPSRALVKRVSTTSGGTTTTLYVGGIYERDTAAGTTHRHYIKTGGTQVVVLTRDGIEQAYWTHTDHLGSPEAITDQARSVIERHSYDAWGRARALDWRSTDVVAASLTNRGFTGHQQLVQVGLIHMGGRVYDPYIGRFLSPDPVIQEAGNLQNLNRYSYGLNNPLSFTDPTGFFFKKLWKAITDFFKENWKTIAVLALTFFTGAWVLGVVPTALAPISHIISSAAAGFVGGFSGTLLHGGSLSDSLRNGLIGGVTGLFLGTAQQIFPSWANTVTQSVGDRLGTQVARTVATATIRGVSAELNGGDFERGFLYGALGETVRWGIEAYAQNEYLKGCTRECGLTLRRGVGGPTVKADNVAVNDVTDNNIGIGWEKRYVDACQCNPHLLTPADPEYWKYWAHEGMALSQAANTVPGMNTMSIWHDKLALDGERWFGKGSAAADFWSKGTIPPAIALTYVGLGSTSITYETGLRRGR